MNPFRLNGRSHFREPALKGGREGGCQFMRIHLFAATIQNVWQLCSVAAKPDVRSEQLTRRKRWIRTVNVSVFQNTCQNGTTPK